jgi:prepilin-type processing-associated H-X9-DG protein
VLISDQLNVGTADGHVGLRYHGGGYARGCDAITV